jgi:hypothetical protein
MIGEQHATSVSARLPPAMLMNEVTPGASLPKQPRRCSSMAEHQLPKLNTRVRFPSSAPVLTCGKTVRRCSNEPLGVTMLSQPDSNSPRRVNNYKFRNDVLGAALKARRSSAHDGTTDLGDG